jgi:hypothetical protein
VNTWYVVIYCHILNGNQLVQFRDLSTKALRCANVNVFKLTQKRCYVTRDGVTGDRDVRDDTFGDIGDDGPFRTATFGTTSLGTIAINVTYNLAEFLPF